MISRFSLLLMLLLVGCSNHPLGISKEQWNQMTLEQQYEATLLQAQHDEAARQRRQQQYLLEQQIAIEQQRLLEERRKNAKWNERIQCSMNKLQMHYGKNWQPVEPTAFELLLGEQRSITLRSTERYRSVLDMEAQFDGLMLRMCRYSNECVVMAGTEQEYRRGKKISFKVDDVLRGEMFCQHPSKY